MSKQDPLNQSFDWCLDSCVAPTAPDPLLELTHEALDAARVPVPIPSPVTCPHCGERLLLVPEDGEQ